MIGWLKKRLGYHVCEEFTQWERKRNDGIVPERFDILTGVTILAVPRYTFVWQERSCKACGRIFQERLDYHGPTEIKT